MIPDITPKPAADRAPRPVWRRPASAAATLTVALAGGIALLPTAASAAPKHPGAIIYQNECAVCHGDRGEGVSEVYEQALYGDRSLEALTRRIDRTMPDDDPKIVTGEDARLVAEWMYDEFYSPAAQARSNPPLVDFTRLTIPQHFNSIADLVGRFRNGDHAFPEGERGLKAEYFDSRNFNRGELKIERVDARIEFDYGTAGPDKDKIDPEEYAIRWEGLLYTGETGTYGFNLRTYNGARLYINNDDDALIDGWVSSGGEMRDERGSMQLLGGRAYRIKVEYFSYKEDKSALELRWTPPNGKESVIPSRNLAPGWAPPLLAVATAFPPDDSSAGYPRGQSISPDWYRATLDAATEAANFILQNADRLADSSAEAGDRHQQWQRFAGEFAAMAFRRPLTDEQQREVVDRPFQQLEDKGEALKRSILRTLTSPMFLYPEANHPQTDDHRIAARLALALWDSVPDEELARAAAAGELTDRNNVRRQAERMLGNYRARAKLNEFIHQWLDLDHTDELIKDPGLYPEFNERIIADLRTSLLMFVDSVVWGESSDYRRLLLAEEMFLNRSLADLYAPDKAGRNGDHLPVDDFVAVAFNGDQRSGVISHPYLLAAFAYHNDTSPIHRGVFLTQNIVGRALRPPPVAISFEDSDFDPHMTMREKVVEMTKDQSCMACHVVINPLGFSLEHYDAIGRWRDRDHKQRPIDAFSHYLTDEGEKIELHGARDVARYAADSDLAHRAFIRQLFHHVVKQPVEAFGVDTMTTLQNEFTASNHHIRNLIATIATISAVHGLDTKTGAGH